MFFSARDDHETEFTPAAAWRRLLHLVGGFASITAFSCFYLVGDVGTRVGGCDGVLVCVPIVGTCVDGNGEGSFVTVGIHVEGKGEGTSVGDSVPALPCSAATQSAKTTEGPWRISKKKEEMLLRERQTVGRGRGQGAFLRLKR